MQNPRSYFVSLLYIRLIFSLSIFSISCQKQPWWIILAAVFLQPTDPYDRLLTFPWKPKIRVVQIASFAGLLILPNSISKTTLSRHDSPSNTGLSLRVQHIYLCSCWQKCSRGVFGVSSERKVRPAPPGGVRSPPRVASFFKRGVWPKSPAEMQLFESHTDLKIKPKEK